MKANNVPDWYIDSCQKIKYMFPKAHAAAYVMMAFRIAYFKVNYPLAYYASYFTVRACDDFDYSCMCLGEETAKQAIHDINVKGMEATTKEKNKLTVLEIIIEFYARGFHFLPIDLYESDAKKFIIKGNGLMLSWNGTVNAIQRSLTGNNGVVIALDEVSRSEERRVGKECRL